MAFALAPVAAACAPAAAARAGSRAIKPVVASVAGAKRVTVRSFGDACCCRSLYADARSPPPTLQPFCALPQCGWPACELATCMGIAYALPDTQSLA